MEEKTKIEIENTRAQMRKGFLEYCILLVISKKEIYAGEILKRLKQADLLVVEGTLYPLLTRLKNAEVLDYVWKESKSGPPRKYYTITNKGKEILRELTKTWSTLDKAINDLIKKQ